jgi:hypothetical protein
MGKVEKALQDHGLPPFARASEKKKQEKEKGGNKPKKCIYPQLTLNKNLLLL